MGIGVVRLNIEYFRFPAGRSQARPSTFSRSNSSTTGDDHDRIGQGCRPPPILRGKADQPAEAVLLFPPTAEGKF
jgi:hypothetical protein